MSNLTFEEQLIVSIVGGMATRETNTEIITTVSIRTAKAIVDKLKLNSTIEPLDNKILSSLGFVRPFSLRYSFDFVSSTYISHDI